MKVYVVSYKSNNTPWEDGVYCVCNTIGKATSAVYGYIDEWEDTAPYIENDHEAVVDFYTWKGKWRIERFDLNVTGL